MGIARANLLEETGSAWGLCTLTAQGSLPSCLR